MPQDSRFATALGVIFGLLFGGIGLGVAGLVIFGDPTKVHNPAIGVVVGLLFAAIGFGIVFAVVYGMRKLKQKAAAQQVNPDSPWLWREDWAAGRAESKNRNTTIGLWIAAIFWNVISDTVAAFAAPALLQKSDLKALIPLGFSLVGVVLLITALRATVRRQRFGKTYFELASLPFVPGRRLTGAIHLRFNTVAPHGIDLRLSCVRQIVTRSGNNSSTNQILLWQDIKNLSANSVNVGAVGEAVIPVEFDIPNDALETNQSQINDQVLWILHAEADVPGVNYTDDFEVPVFRSMPFAVPVPVANSSARNFANFSSGGRFGYSSAGAATAPAFESDASDVAAPANPTGVVSTTPNGGTEFYFHAFRNPGKVLALILFTLVWTGVVYFLHRSPAPGIFPVVFGLFDLLLVYASIQSALGTVRIEMGNGKLAVRKALLGIGSSQELPFGDIDKILAVTGSYQGTSVKSANYSIRLLRKNGKKLPLVDAIYDRQEARWLVTQLEKLAGLKLDTHVAVDAPFAAYAGYGGLPQRGQAPVAPSPALKRGNRLAGIIGTMLFLAWIGYVAYRMMAPSRPVPHPSRQSQLSR